MNNLIQWPRAKYWDRAWNPVIGCRPCSPACENCYAAAWAKRFGKSFEPHESAAQLPPSRGVVFCGNLTDLFGEWVRNFTNYLAPTCNAFSDSARAYLWLTKRAKRMARYLNSLKMGPAYAKAGWFDNHYFGFTAEDQKWFARRHAESMSLPLWANMWYSLEPLLGPIQLGAGLVRSTLRWIVVGCESGPNRRSCKLEWVESIVGQCISAGVPVFVKQLDLGGRCVTDIEQFPEHLRVRQVPWKAK